MRGGFLKWVNGTPAPRAPRPLLLFSRNLLMEAHRSTHDTYQAMNMAIDDWVFQDRQVSGLRVCAICMAYLRAECYVAE